jgi:biopolymer transport protein ExbD
VRIRDAEIGEETGLSMAPLIDVVFLLLIFFMVATTYLDPERELEIDLPSAASGTLPERAPDELVISVQKDGSLALGGRPVERAELERALADAALHSRETPVTIRGDRAALHETIVGVLDACGSAGLSNLAVGTLER